MMLRRVLLMGLGLVLALTAACGAVSRPAPGEFRFPLKQIAAPQSVTTVKLADYGMESPFTEVVHVVRLSDGQLLVLSGKDLIGGCTVAWDARGHVFRNPCHGAVYSIRGQVVAGPAPQGLGRFADRVDQADKLLVADMTKPPVPVESR